MLEAEPTVSLPWTPIDEAQSTVAEVYRRNFISGHHQQRQALASPHADSLFVLTTGGKFGTAKRVLPELYVQQLRTLHDDALNLGPQQLRVADGQEATLLETLADAQHEQRVPRTDNAKTEQFAKILAHRIKDLKASLFEEASSGPHRKLIAGVLQSRRPLIGNDEDLECVAIEVALEHIDRDGTIDERVHDRVDSAVTKVIEAQQPEPIVDLG